MLVRKSPCGVSGVSGVVVAVGVVAIGAVPATGAVPAAVVVPVAVPVAGAVPTAVELPQVEGMLVSADWQPIFRPSLPWGVAAAWVQASRVDLKADSYWDFIAGSMDDMQASIFVM